MPLSAEKPILQKAIFDAFEKATTEGKKAINDRQDHSAKIKLDLANDLANAIDAYVLSAQVNIAPVVSTVPAGVAVTTLGSPTTQSGVTTSPGIAKHSGFGTLQ